MKNLIIEQGFNATPYNKAPVANGYSIPVNIYYTTYSAVDSHLLNKRDVNLTLTAKAGLEPTWIPPWGTMLFQLHHSALLWWGEKELHLYLSILQ